MVRSAISVASGGGAGLSVKLGWRVYLRTKHFDFYTYTVVGARSEKEAIAAVRAIITPGRLPLIAKVATIEDVENYPPLPR
jgi:hypothetical protein